MIWDIIEAQTNANPDHPALILDAKTLSYGDLVERVRATGLSDNVGAGRTIIRHGDPLDVLLQVLACWQRARVPVLLRDGQTEDSIARITDRLSRNTLEHRVTLGPRDEALIICTSGTTGAPKLVALPAEAVTLTAKAIASDLGVNCADILAVTTPLSYMYGLMGASMTGLLAGATLRLFADNPLPTEVFAALRRDRVTVVQMPPSLLRLYLSYWNETPFDDVRMFTIGGEHVDVDLAQRAAAMFPASAQRFLYGMTEAGPRISHVHHVGSSSSGSFIGTPFPHFEWTIAPLEDRDLPEGAGRLLLRGPTMFLGYVGDNDAYEGVGADGYFQSNDIVMQTADGLRFVERLDRQFKSGGKLVSPTEVEAALLSHPAVSQARCFSAPHPILGFSPAADVIMHAGSSVTVADLKAHCRDVLQAHNRPRHIEIVVSFALSKSGKRR